MPQPLLHIPIIVYKNATSVLVLMLFHFWQTGSYQLKMTFLNNLAKGGGLVCIFKSRPRLQSLVREVELPKQLILRPTVGLAFRLVK